MSQPDESHDSFGPIYSRPDKGAVEAQDRRGFMTRDRGGPDVRPVVKLLAGAIALFFILSIVIAFAFAIAWSNQGL